MSRIKSILGNAFQEWLPNYANKEAEEMEYYYLGCQVMPEKEEQNSYLAQFKRLDKHDQAYAIVKAKTWGNNDLVNKMQQIHTDAI